jgi:hypothetical protein
VRLKATKQQVENIHRVLDPMTVMETIPVPMTTSSAIVPYGSRDHLQLETGSFLEVPNSSLVRDFSSFELPNFDLDALEDNIVAEPDTPAIALTPPRQVSIFGRSDSIVLRSSQKTPASELMVIVTRLMLIQYS